LNQENLVGIKQHTQHGLFGLALLGVYLIFGEEINVDLPKAYSFINA
tara:strand:+ start:389 stop:529 length:141 start_codon:yes stop_codon:yes gene_type:complete